MKVRTHPFPLDYAPPRRSGAGWITTAEIASIAAAIGLAGALITLSHDMLRDSRGWETNDALILFCGAGSLAAVVSLACFGVGRHLSKFAFRRRAVVGMCIDAISLGMLCVWAIKTVV